ncbi:MAG TPA: indolepyruvate ferredoxin oxidoreductase subunit alpha [Firmicutes bacterium]|nr:indolepyruvate ferredoxin oxidoreductase subunit alpha [Bacillota bacterium]
MDKELLSGNEAIARGAYEAGVQVATAYPGTPSTEILEAIGKRYKGDIYCEWSVNEKVAVEVAMGASFAGARALSAMKHVGLNVAADPVFSLSYIGATGGIIIVTADDPYMHSSQNEQDNRNYGRHAYIPVLEPSDSQECKDYVVWGIKISEEFDTPVLLRLTTRISHSKSIVELGERVESPEPDYVKELSRRVILPAFARKLRLKVIKRLKKLAEFAEIFPENRVEMNDTKIGIITSGISYNYVKEVAPQASVLKLGMVYPLPPYMIKKFAESVDDLYVVEELDPFIETEVNRLGIFPKGKSYVPLYYELNPERVECALKGEPDPVPEMPEDAPLRPPVLCPGCPHANVFYHLHRMKMIVTGDIGCYTLGALPPLNAMDTCVCMGASVTNAIGIEKALGRENAKKIVAVIGDSTFIHSGITGLIDAVYNKGHSNIIILDNRTTAMTGHQPHPGTGKTLMGDETFELNYEELAKACGATYVKTFDPYDVEETAETLKEAFEHEGVSVIVSKRECALLARDRWKEAMWVDVEMCNGCRICLQLGCPALGIVDKKAVIDEVLCIGCGVCSQLCPEDAIKTHKEASAKEVK